MAGGAGAVAGGLATVAGSTGAHLSGELAKLSGARDHPGERRPRRTSHVASAPPFFHYTFSPALPFALFLSLHLPSPTRMYPEPCLTLGACSGPSCMQLSPPSRCKEPCQPLLKTISHPRAQGHLQGAQAARASLAIASLPPLLPQPSPSPRLLLLEQHSAAGR